MCVIVRGIIDDATWDARGDRERCALPPCPPAAADMTAPILPLSMAALRASISSLISWACERTSEMLQVKGDNKKG